MKNTLWANISWESFHYVCTYKCKTHFHPTSPHLPIPHMPLLNLYLNPNFQLLCKANYRKVILLPDWGRYSLTGRAVSTLHHYREGHTDHPQSYSKGSATLTWLQGWVTLPSLVEGSTKCCPLLQLQRPPQGSVQGGNTGFADRPAGPFQTCRAKLGFSCSKTLNQCLKQKNTPLLFENFWTSSQSLHFF